MSSSFTLNDIEGTLLAVLFLASVLFVPGYVAAWVANILSFRTASLFERIPTATCLSVCISPITISLLARKLSVRSCAVIFILCFVVFLVLVLREWKGRPRIFPLPRFVFAGSILVFIGAVVLILSFVDVQIGSKIYPTAAVLDHGVRTSFIESSVRTGAPPANPLFYPGEYVASRYYYFWSVLCALPVALAGLTPRVAFYGSAIWTAFALASLIPLYLKHFLNDSASLHRKSLLGIALLAVTGFDLAPTLLVYWAQHLLPADMEWWNAGQITSWADALIWVPHHVASVIACLGGFLVLWNSKSRLGKWLWCDIVVAALSFSSAAGLSIYVTMSFAFFFLIWTLRYLMQREFHSFRIFALTGVLAFLIAVPYLRDLKGPAASFFSGSVGQGDFAQPTANGPSGGLSVEPRALGITPKGHWWTTPSLIFEMTVLYFFEFGFFAFVIVIVLRAQAFGRVPLSEAQRAAWYLTGIVFPLATFVRSSVIRNNDFGWRSMMLVQFVVLLWGVLLVYEVWFGVKEEHKLSQGKHGGLKGILAIALAFGFAGTFYQLTMLRTALMIADWGHTKILTADEPLPPNIGHDTFEYREGFETLDRNISLNSVVQYNPWAKDTAALLIYNRHQMVAANEACGIAFGGSRDKCEILKKKLARIFSVESGKAVGGDELDALCDELKIKVLIAHRSDALWDRADSWIWQRGPIVANQAMRAIPCGVSPTVEN